MQNSIIRSCFRAILVTFSTMIGIALGLIPVIIVIAALFSSVDDLKVSNDYKLKVAPNANDVRKVLSNDAPVILKLNIHGIIGLDDLKTEKVGQLLTESREDELKNDRVKAVLLHIDTPGGTVSDSDGIYRKLMAYKERHNVPIYGYVDGLCASGGMYIASSCEKLFASEASVVGSVGVLSPSFFNLVDLMEKVGVKSLTLKAGKGKDNMNPLRPWKPGEQDNFQDLINYYYDQFVDIVVEGRPQINRNELIEKFGARVYPSGTAKELGFIDVSGASINDAMKALVMEIGIEDDYYQVVEMESKEWVSKLLRSDSALFTGKIKHEVPGMESELMNKYLYLYRPTP